MDILKSYYVGSEILDKQQMWISCLFKPLVKNASDQQEEDDLSSRRWYFLEFHHWLLLWKQLLKYEN